MKNSVILIAAIVAVAIVAYIANGKKADVEQAEMPAAASPMNGMVQSDTPAQAPAGDQAAAPAPALDGTPATDADAAAAAAPAAAPAEAGNPIERAAEAVQDAAENVQGTNTDGTAPAAAPDAGSAATNQ